MILKMLKFLRQSTDSLIAGLLILAIFSSLGLAQSFFPRYPNRLNYIIGELNQASQDLVYLNGKLKNSTESCNCKNAISQCGQDSALGPPKRIELNPMAFDIGNLSSENAVKNAGSEIDRLKNQVISSINNVQVFLIVSKQEKVSRIRSLATITEEQTLIFEGNKEDLEKYLKDAETEVKLTLSEIKKLENTLQGFKNLNNALDEAKNTIEKTEEELGGILEKAENNLKQKIAQIPTLSEKLKNKLTQITNDLKQQITGFPDSIKSLLMPFSCKSDSPEVFGESCPKRKEIEKMQVEIRNKTNQICYLRELLQKEMESGLEAELETLREEEAEQLKNNLNDVLSSSEKIIAPALNNIEILNDDKYTVEKQCQADCEQGIPFGLQACIFENLGEQNPIKFIFEVGASLEELELGEIGINEIGLNLPDKIGLSGISGLADFKIPLSNIIITFPPTPTSELENLSTAPIIFHPPSPSLPEFPWANFSCPQIGAQVYQCQEGKDTLSNSYINFEWYIQTFSWLSEKCQEIPGMQDNYGALKEECFNKDNVHLTIIQRCDTLWQAYYACLKKPSAKCSPPSGICARYNVLQKECKDLFTQEGESSPSDCGINTLKNKCSQLKEQNREQAPEACMLIPVFTRELKEPESQSYQETSTSCPAQTISDNPGTGIRLDCPLSISGLSGAIPKINLPDIIIPDIRLPSFNFSPFLKVKLPNFIFEDLILSELELCNLDDCLGLIPALALEIPYPTLAIPPIEIPPFYGSVPTMPGLEPIPITIEMGKIEFPSIPIPLTELDLANLITLDLQLPEIPIPFPEIVLDLKGLDIDVSNMLLGLVASIIDIPSGCIGVGISGIPLVIAFPDYYFYWSRFPDMPDLCNNKYISTDKFCEKIKDSLDSKEVVDKINKIQDTLNQTIENNLQKNLDKIAVLYEDLVKEHITENLEKISAKIEKEVEKNIQKALAKLEGKAGEILEIEPIEVPLDDITVPMEKINAKLAKIPLEFPIPWPEGLKKIKLSKPISYQLPSIPLEDLSYTKEIELKVPGFQFPSLEFSIDFLGNYPSCEGQSPSGGNPYPVSKINANLQQIISIEENINGFSEKINQILE